MEPTVLQRKQPIAAIREKLAHNLALQSVMLQFASRQRTRSSLTVNGLALSMKKEGFTFSKDHYQNILKLLADNGFGTLKYTKTGKPLALTDIKITLQSIGKAVLQGETKLQSFRPANKFVPLDETTKAPVQKAFVEKAKTTFGVSINLQLSGGPIVINRNNKIDMERLGEVLTDINTILKKYERVQ